MNQSYVDHQAYEWQGCFESLENSFVSVELHHKTLCRTTKLISLRTVEISNPKIALPNKNSTWTRSTIRNSETTLCKMETQLTRTRTLMIAQLAGMLSA